LARSNFNPEVYFHHPLTQSLTMKFTHALFACAAAAVGVATSNAADCDPDERWYKNIKAAHGICHEYDSTKEGCTCDDDALRTLNRVATDIEFECTVTEKQKNAFYCDPNDPNNQPSGASSNVPLSFAAAIAAVVGYVAAN
jgi:hypothetical protein